MRRSRRSSAFVLALVALILPTLFAPCSLPAQDDRAAGLFTEAAQLPLVSQSVAVRSDGTEAVVQLVQVFVNEGDRVAQADYRLHLPAEATVTGFGFWRKDSFLAAELKERGEARRDHRAAVDADRATGLLQREGRIHSFSVHPVEAESLQEVETTLRLPVVRERGRSHLRLPLDTFLGQGQTTSTVTVELETPEPLRKIGVENARETILRQRNRRASLAFASRSAAEVWWAEEAPPLLARAEAVPLDDGSYATQLRVILNDAGEGPEAYRKLVFLVDTSASMRRRGRAVLDAVSRVLEQSPAPVRILSVAGGTVDVPRDDRRALLEGLFGGAAGFHTTWSDLENAALAADCGGPGIRCLALTDPQVLDLPEDRRELFEALFLADADELAHFADTLGPDARTHQPDVEPRASLHARLDEAILPVLEVEEIDQPGGTLEIPGAPRRRVAEGGMLRILLRTRSTEDLELTYRLRESRFTRRLPLRLEDPEARSGRGIRRALYRLLLDTWEREYHRLRDPELRRQIVEVSLREGIPTNFTALHADEQGSSRRLPSGSTPAPLLRLVGGLLLLLGGGGWVLTGGRP